MATGVNKIVLLGNLGSDPEPKYLPSGEAVLNISLCTDESYYDKKNDRTVEHNEWHSLVLFGRRAEVLAEHCRKGDNLYIEGKNRTRNYEKDGIKKYVTEIHVTEVKFTYGSGSARSRNANPQQAQPSPSAAQQTPHAQAGYAAPAMGFWDNTGAPLPPNLVQFYKANGYPDGWVYGTPQPIIQQA